MTPGKRKEEQAASVKGLPGVAADGGFAPGAGVDAAGGGMAPLGGFGGAGLPSPHGGRLVDRVLDGQQAKAWRSNWGRLPQITLDDKAMSDAIMLASGAFSPLKGFMTRDDYEPVVEHMRLANGLPWTLPVTLPLGEKQAALLTEGQWAALVAADGQPVGVIKVEDMFRYNKARQAHYVYGTESPDHPGVQRLYRQGTVAVGGLIALFQLPTEVGGSPAFTPAQVRQEFVARGWRNVVGFQTRNPIHRAHEYIQKCALELADGLLLHPLVGPTRRGDLPAAVRMASYEAILHHYYPRQRVFMTGFPAAMRYAGPREAIFHALIRKNYGCRYFIVGRDHAGVGGFYDPYACQTIFSRFPAQQLGVTPLFFEPAFYCRACGGMATGKTCPHDPAQRVELSGTQVRELLAAGETLPREFSRPEVARILAQAHGAADEKA